MNAIELTNVSKRYGNFRLKDITVQIPEGCILGIIGENGAGKSTLLEIILGLTAKDSGKVTVLGCDDLSKHHEIREKIGFVIEKAGFPSVLSAKDMNSILKDTYQNWNEAYYFEILNRLEGDTDRKFKTLSQGNRMKVLIAAALAHQPQLLIMDEATNFLDPSARAEVTNILYEYTRDEHRTVVLSSHITSDLEKTADYILFLHKGEILGYAPKDEILDQYRYVTAEPEIIDSLEDGMFIARRETGYGSEAVIKSEALTEDMHVRSASLEEIFTALVKGVI